MSAAARTLRLPPLVIALDLLGTLLLLAGIFDLVGVNLPGTLSATIKGYGAILAGGGVGMMLLGAVILVASLLKSRKQTAGVIAGTPASNAVKTVDRRSR